VINRLGDGGVDPHDGEPYLLTGSAGEPQLTELQTSKEARDAPGFLGDGYGSNF